MSQNAFGYQLKQAQSLKRTTDKAHAPSLQLLNN